MPVTDALLRSVYWLENRFDDVRLGWHRRRGWRMPIRIVPYRGYGRGDRFFVRARVIRDRGEASSEEPMGWLGTLSTNIKRYMTHEIAGARVEICINGMRREAVADREGFVELWIDAERPLSGDHAWHEVDFRLVTPGSRTGAWQVKGHVMAVPETADCVIVSDIDDTVVQMGARHPLKKARALFLMSAKQRVPFAGVAAFYHALKRGPSGVANNPVFFVSSSPWNLFEHLVEFFELHDIPMAPMILRDWGLTDRGFAPLGGHAHKLEPVRNLLEFYRDLPFILIGDSGQEDAEIYAKIAEAYPGRILAIYIRNVTASRRRHRELAQIAERVKAGGSEIVVVKDTLEAARHAVERRWIEASALSEVEQGKRLDQSRAGPLERVLSSAAE